MGALQLPLWFVTAQPGIPPHPLHDYPPVPLVFTSTEKLVAFMDEQANGSWDVVHATDEGGLVVTIADLHRLSTTRAIVDPDSDGSRGEMVSIAQVLALSRRWDQ